MSNDTQNAFEIFFDNPQKDNFLNYIDNNTGESNQVDFKGQWIDVVGIAKTLLGMANCGGGCVVFGVSEKSKDQDKPIINFHGLNKDDVKDEAEITPKLYNYVPDQIKIELLTFDYNDKYYSKTYSNKIFQVLFIKVDTIDLPVVCKKDGTKIHKGDIYIRKGTSSEKISHDALQELINANVEQRLKNIQTKDFKDELDELKVLHNAIPFRNRGFDMTMFSHICGRNTEATISPAKSFDQFLLDMINSKQKKLEKYLLR